MNADPASYMQLVSRKVVHACDVISVNGLRDYSCYLQISQTSYRKIVNRGESTNTHLFTTSFHISCGGNVAESKPDDEHGTTYIAC